MKIPYWYLLLGPSIAFATGFLMNSAVMAANHSQMPVHFFGGDNTLLDPDDIRHCAMTAHTHLKFLADWVVIGRTIASPGDFLLWAYDATLIPSLVAWVALVIKDKNKDLGS